MKGYLVEVSVTAGGKDKRGLDINSVPWETSPMGVHRAHQNLSPIQDVWWQKAAWRGG